MLAVFWMGKMVSVKITVRETQQFHDGRWLFIPITTETDVQDVEQLLLGKKRPVCKPGEKNS